MPCRRYRVTATAVVAALAATGCSSAARTTAAKARPLTAPTKAPAATTTSTPAATTSTTSSTTLAATTTTAAVAAFTDSVSSVTAADVPYTWRAGCPVGPAQLRMITMTYWGFDNQPHTGHMVVNASVVADVVKVFATLYDERFPIYEMIPEDAYQGNDNLAAAADDTSGFNCRDAVAPGPPQWSVHAYGEAIDVNDVQNPYVDGSTVIPPAGAAYLDRADIRPGMAYWGGELVDAFASVGWYWGGRWSPGTDYQHFSLTGG